MRFRIIKSIIQHPFTASITIRWKTTSAQYVASRAREPTFDKLMESIKTLPKVIAIQDLILANPTNNPPSVSLDFLSGLSQKLHLNRGAPLSFADIHMSSTSSTTRDYHNPFAN
ncbi:hypothetical protein JCGZ_20268 [Jatropha curcas]|uniref:Uncharacterized protein n=1 Tax=Jatropha curcas TaxID=180498 RepID=A0A067JTP6_JATCU|nr:hypothetical protein JCGZ_20268 [Jatropha curcas]